VLALSGLVALFAPACGGGSSSTTEIKDSEVRTYIRDSLVVFLDSLTKEVCEEHDRENQPTTWLCKPGTDTYKPPPPNGKP
jgi:hypothetical protein